MHHTYNIFPTTIYLGEIVEHQKCKEEFYKLYPKFDYEETDKHNTVSEKVGNPLIHLEDTLDPLFTEIVDHTKKYVCEILNYKDIFNYIITKTWLSRMRDTKCIPWHIHSTSHVSFCYYVNMPPHSHAVEFENPHYKNSLFLGSTSDIKYEEQRMLNEINEENASTYYMVPPEGHVALFPSSLTHRTKCMNDNFNDERLAIVGDITLMLKEEHLHYSMGYIDEKYWKKYK